MKKICLLLFAAVALTAALATALYFSNDGQEPAPAQPVGENLAAADAVPGLSPLPFNPAPTLTTVYSSTPQNLCEVYGCDLWDANHSPQFGLVAVGQACPSPAPRGATRP